MRLFLNAPNATRESPADTAARDVFIDEVQVVGVVPIDTVPILKKICTFAALFKKTQMTKIAHREKTVRLQEAPSGSPRGGEKTVRSVAGQMHRPCAQSAKCLTINQLPPPPTL